MRKTLAAIVASGAIGVLALPFATAPACLPQGACDFTYSLYCDPVDGGNAACGGRVIDDTHWESSPLEGKWLAYPKNGIIRLDPRDRTGRKVKGAFVRTQAWISACDTPSSAGCNFALAAGNNAEWHWLDADRTVEIHNNTCESFYFRAVIETDGIESTDGSSQDGTKDAASD